MKAEFEAGNISINKVPGIAALPEEEQMIFLNLLQSGKSIELDQIKLYKNQLELNEQEKKAALEEKERLEEELERVKNSNEKKLKEVQEEIAQKEEYIRDEIKRAEQQKNENRIVKLQEELKNEKLSSTRLYNQTNQELEQTKKALEEANSRLKGIEEKEKMGEKALTVKARMLSQLNMIGDLVGKFMSAYDEYQSYATTNPESVKSDLKEEFSKNRSFAEFYEKFCDEIEL